jgi:hypothetical protein
LTIAGVCAAWTLASSAVAQDAGAPSPALAEKPPEADTEKLAKQLANPVSSLISVPFQNNVDCCYGPSNAAFYTLNVQPVVPVSLNQDWNVIVRTILPIVNHPSVAPGVPSAFGVSDVTQSFFFSPKRPVGGWIVGIGPAMVYPLGNAQLGSQKWSAGPTFVVLRQDGHLTYGMLANQVWSFAGKSTRSEVNQMFLQPFVSYTQKDSTSYTLSTESTHDWVTKSWNVPLIIQVGHIYRFGHQLVQLQAGAKGYATSPNGGPGWGLRFNATLLFPKKPPVG